MRIKRQSKARKSLEFFTRIFSFEAPFKFLLDPDFLLGIIKSGLKLRDSLENLISSPGCKVFLTTCIKRELDALAVTPGPRMGEWKAVIQMISNETNKIQYVACRHSKDKKNMTAHKCILAAVAAQQTKQSSEKDESQQPKKPSKEKKSNPEHFICCAQHSELRKQIRDIPAVPTVFLHSNVLIFEEPSAVTKEYATRFKVTHHHKVSSKENLKILERLTQYAPEKNQVLETALQNGGEIGNLPSTPLGNTMTTIVTRNTTNTPTEGPRIPTIGRKQKAKGVNPLANKKPKPKQMPTLRPKKQQQLQESVQKVTANLRAKQSQLQATQPNKKQKQNAKSLDNQIVQLAPPANSSAPASSKLEPANAKKRKLQ